jgi:hypothetical protein
MYARLGDFGFCKERASEREREREEKLFARHRIRFKYVTKSYFNGPRAGRGGGGGAGVRATRITLVPDVI